MNREMLEDTIKKSGLRMSYICARMGMERTGFYRKRTGERSFTESEIKKLGELFGEERIAEVFAD